MRTKLWSMAALLLLVIGGLVYAGVQASSRAPSPSDGNVCPVMGEELPCPRCCPWQ